MRVHPVLVRKRFLALAIEPLPLGRRRLFDPFGLHQAGDMLVIAVPVVPSHDGLQRCVGFQCSRIDSQILAAQQAFPGQPLQHPGEHGFVCSQVHPAPRLGQRRVVWRLLLQTHAQKIPQAE